MSEAVEDLICDAIVTELNANAQAWYPLPNAAARSYDYVFDQDEATIAAFLATLQVAVMPLTLDNQRITRGGTDRCEYGVVIDLLAKVAPATTAAVEALNLTAQQIHDWFRTPHVLSGTAYECIHATRPEIFVPSVLWQERIWESYVNVTVRTYR